MDFLSRTLFYLILCLSVLAAWPGFLLETHLSRENRVFYKMSSFSTLFSKRGSHFLVLHSVSVHFLILLSLIHHHCGNLQILSPTCYHSIYLQGKVWVLFSTLCFAFSSCFCVLLGIHISLTCVWSLECMMFSFLCGFNLIYSIV